MLLRDLRYAWRSLMLRHNRAFTVATVLSFALGIGAATAIFSIVHVVLLAPLPYHESERVFRMSERNPSIGLMDFSVSTPNFLSWQQELRSFEALAAIDAESANIGSEGHAERVPGMRASASIWQVLGMPLVAGRAFTQAEDTVGGPAVVIIGEGVWRSRYDADPALIGRPIAVNGEQRVVVGIAPQDVGFATDIGVWLPMTPDPETYGRGDRRLNVLGRLAPGIAPQQAQEELDRLSRALAQEFPDSNTGWEGALRPVRDWIVGDDVRTRLMLLLGAVLVLMLVACLNVANLQIARGTAREREMGVRQALGAARSRLLAQMVVENLLLAAIGGALGLLFAYAAVQLATAVLPSSTPRLAAFALDLRAAAIAIVVTAGTAIAFGLLPALTGMRTQLATVLQQLGRSTLDARRGPLRQALVVAQFTLATMLVVSAALLAQHLQRLQDTSLGFESDRLLIARITFPQENENVDTTEHQRVHAQLLQEIRALPGVQSAGLTSEIPLGRFNTTSMRVAAGGSGPLDYRQEGESASWRVVSSDYLPTLGVPLLRGRGFADEESPRSIMLSEGLARRLWPNGEDPIGLTVRLGNGQTRNVVGIVGDVRQLGLGEAPTPTMYMPNTWIVLPTMTLVLRSAGDPSTLTAQIRDIATRVSPDQPLFDLRTMNDVRSGSVAEPRVQTLVLLAFAGSSLLLAAFGVAGVMAYLVARRRPELAVRMALGATPRKLIWHVVRRGGALCIVGVALGSLLLLTVSDAWAPLAATADVPRMLALGVSVLLAVGVFACWLPAHGVTRITPSSALRDE